MASSDKVNRTVRGASPSDARHEKKNRGQWIVHGLKAIVMLAVAVAGIYAGLVWFSSQLERPVTSVKINGEFVRVSREHVASRVYAAMGASFMKLDLQRIQISLEEEPWVDRARVARRWPDQLEVTVVEHQPIARWGTGKALNHRGEVIELEGESEADDLLSGLPALYGLEGMEREVMTQYYTLTKLLTEHGLTVNQLTCDATRSWSLRLSDGVQIEIGRDQVLERMGRFIVVFEQQLQQRWAELSRVDLRYYNGVAVKWREAVST